MYNWCQTEGLYCPVWEHSTVGVHIKISPPGMFLSPDLSFFLDIGLNVLTSDSFMSDIFSKLGYLLVSFRLYNWLSTRRLVPWIKHLHPTYWSTFRKSVLNDSWFVRDENHENYQHNNFCTMPILEMQHRMNMNIGWERFARIHQIGSFDYGRTLVSIRFMFYIGETGEFLTNGRT